MNLPGCETSFSKREKSMMLYPDLSLAQRLEFHEAWSSSAHARTQAQLFPETGAVSQRIADSLLVYCGKKSPLSRVYGWGLSGPVSAVDLDMIEEFYQSRQLKPRVRACPLADPSLYKLLGEHRYVLQEHMNVYARQIHTVDYESPTIPDLRIQIATLDHARLWFELDGAHGDWAEPDGLAFMLIRCALKSNTQLFLAWLNGHPVSGGAIEIRN